MDDAEHLPFYVLFGVIVASMLVGVFIVQYSRQLEVRVDEQAQALADDLTRMSFATLSREQPSFALPRTVGGSEYELHVDENSSAFIVRVKAGRRAGMSYYSAVNAKLRVENSRFVPGGDVYFRQSGDVVLVSSSPITAPVENLPQPATATPPEFYHFARENAKAATAITASYLFALQNSRQIDIVGYAHEGDNVLVQVSRGGWNLFGVRVSGHENGVDVGKIDKAWVVTSLAIRENLTGVITSPSVENAATSGWLYPPAQVLMYLRGRTWQLADNRVVVIPAGAACNAAAATTNVATYPTWRFEFTYEDQNYVIHYQLMPWWWAENAPGFVFQSTPELTPLT